MELSVESLPAFRDLDDELCEEIEDLIRAGKLSPEDAAGYDGWLTARDLGSRALIGCVGYEREAEGDTSNIYMQSLVVDKAHRKHGIGRQLTERLFEESVSPGEKLVALTLFWNNEFYQKLGFYKVNAKEIKAQDEIAGREKHKYCTAWVKEKAADKTGETSRRTDEFRKLAVKRIELWRSFLQEHPEIDLDDDGDLTDEQASAWDSYVREKGLGS